MKPYHIFSLAILALLSLSCDDDDDTRPLRAESGGATFEELNGCDIGSGSNATEFAFRLELESAPTMTLGGVEFDIEWEDGSESDDRFDDNLDISGSTVEFDWCMRFGPTDWFEIDAVIVDEEDRPLSNEVTIRVNKPAGAN